jgi:hypothetical protein
MDNEMQVTFVFATGVELDLRTPHHHELGRNLRAELEREGLRLEVRKLADGRRAVDVSSSDADAVGAAVASFISSLANAGEIG